MWKDVAITTFPKVILAGLCGHLADVAFDLGIDYTRPDLLSDPMILIFGTEPPERLWIVSDNHATH